MWIVQVWAILNIPVGTSGEGQCLRECLVGHDRTSLKEVRCSCDSARMGGDDQDGKSWDVILKGK